MRKRLAPLVLAAAAFPQPAQAVSRAQAYAVTTTNQLIAFNTGSPSTIDSAVAISGLQPGEDLVGLDRNPRSHVWFGLGSTGRLYRINVVRVETAARPGWVRPDGALRGPARSSSAARAPRSGGAGPG